MSFRLSNLNICRAGMMGFVCLAFVGASRAGEGARNIEVVPLHGTAMDTNFDQSSQADDQGFKAWSPRAPRSNQRQAPNAAMIPPPQPQTTMSPERERELLDRRRNWVFMTPEDYESPGGKKNEVEENSPDKKSTTAMERYWQRLYDSDHAAATNQFGKLDSDRSGGRTNLLGGEQRVPDERSFADSPFNANTDAGAFQSLRRNDFSNPFGSDANSALPTPEEVRQQAEQKAHMESFRQLWNIDQPAPAPVVSSPVSAPIDSGPLFGLSSPGMQRVNSFSSSDNNSSSARSQTPESTVTSSRNTRPPHADFVPAPRPF